MEVREIALGETEIAYEALLELRPQLGSARAFVERVDGVQRSDGYRLAGAIDGGRALAVAGFRVLENLWAGRVFYVDDLATHSSARRAGHAAALFAWLVEEARRLDCDQLHLDSGYLRHDAHRFYLNRGLQLRSHHFALTLR